MLQIVIGMGCVYLVLKAIAITQAGLAVRPENGRRANFYSVAAMIIGIGGAALFMGLMLDHSEVVAGIGTAPY
ncbi:MAG: hypothetical protein Q8S53_14410 [Brevundimonas sp.]|uniref:hypothetical protein n=1 Tax=Brevundimonas sp. TaxID=1871086 RepID=UPI00273721F9|nr:hypothetical protein [Brevundimonas sp.]MDP3379554.1 hypothetical protein [Brevundimonas sp.]